MLQDSKVAIILLNWNGKKDTLECLSSLQKLSYKNIDIIVVDNGSTDDSVREIRLAFPKTCLIETGKNLGFAGGNNPGIEHALKNGADYLLLLNNDTIAHENLIEGFLATAPSAPILGAKLYLYSEPNMFDHLGGTWNPKTASFDLIGNRAVEDNTSFESPIELDYACGAALFVKREVFEKIGLLEPKFFLIWEESDFCFRARRAGFITKLAPGAKVWHKVSASFVGGKPHSTYFWWRNRLFWIARNCTPNEKRRLFLHVVFPEALHILKLYLLKSLLLPFSKKSKREEKKRNLRKQKAALAGVRDYLLCRFGNAPAWIYKS